MSRGWLPLFAFLLICAGIAAIALVLRRPEPAGTVTIALSCKSPYQPRADKIRLQILRADNTVAADETAILKPGEAFPVKFSATLRVGVYRMKASSAACNFGGDFALLPGGHRNITKGIRWNRLNTGGAGRPPSVYIYGTRPAATRVRPFAFSWWVTGRGCGDPVPTGPYALFWDSSFDFAEDSVGYYATFATYKSVPIEIVVEQNGERRALRLVVPNPALLGPLPSIRYDITPQMLRYAFAEPANRLVCASH
jgi:hypothetical protein